MEKQPVQKLIDSNSTRVSFETYVGKSAVWKSFVIVTVDGGKVPFVKCTKCNVILTWKSKDGTHGLSGHLHHCPGTGSAQTKLTAMPCFSKAPAHTPVKCKCHGAGRVQGSMLRVGGGSGDLRHRAGRDGGKIFHPCRPLVWSYL